MKLVPITSTYNMLIKQKHPTSTYNHYTQLVNPSSTYNYTQLIHTTRAYN